jgi:hypothetical protein
VYDDCLEFFNKYETFESAWLACERGDWMLYIAANLNIDKRTLTLAKGHCANTVRHFMMDDRSIKAVDTAIAYGEGRATENELNDYLIYAYTAFHNAIESFNNKDTYTSRFYSPAKYAAGAAYMSIANDSACVAHMASSAIYYSVNVDEHVAFIENQKLTADICHKYLTELVLQKIKEYEKD